MSLRNAIAKLAKENPELRKDLLPILRKTAMEFDTPEALKKYLKEHPGADKTRHKVVEQKGKGRKPEKQLSKAEHTHKLPGGTKVRVYDNGGDSLDRYTVVMDDKDWDTSVNPGMKAMLGLSEGGRGVSQFSEGKEGPHLGKAIKFDDLDADTKKHITRRIEEDT